MCSYRIVHWNSAGVNVGALTGLTTSMAQEDTQVSCDGYDPEQEEATHPVVYYTLKQDPDGVYRAECMYCGRRWASAE